MNTLISIVIPVYNEENNIPLLVEKVDKVFSVLSEYEYECLFVNDGSTDASRSVLSQVAANNPHVRPIHLVKNSGQSAAIIAGMRRAKGEFILMLDGDLQNDPADFPRMLTLLQECDCVCGYREKREDSWLKRRASRIANRIRRWWLDDDIRDAGCGAKGFRRVCVEHMIPFNGMHRYFGVMMKAAGLHITEMPVRHHRRQFGVSKYGVMDRLWRGIYDLIGVAWLRKRYVAVRVEGEE